MPERTLGKQRIRSWFLPEVGFGGTRKKRWRTASGEKAGEIKLASRGSDEMAKWDNEGHYRLYGD